MAPVATALERADVLLYQAKRRGRDRVEAEGALVYIGWTCATHWTCRKRVGARNPPEAHVRPHRARRPAKLTPMPLGCLASLFGIQKKPAASAQKGTVPEALPLEVKRYFFSRDENTFFAALEESLAGTPYRVFPNVRLNDLFTITAQEGKNAVYARLRDKHVDFLLVDTAAAYRPVLAIELDGRSHQNEKQQRRDAVKDVAFRSAGMKLARLPSRAYSAAELTGLLQAELPAARDRPAPRR